MEVDDGFCDVMRRDMNPMDSVRDLRDIDLTAQPPVDSRAQKAIARLAGRVDESLQHFLPRRVLTSESDSFGVIAKVVFGSKALDDLSQPGDPTRLYDYCNWHGPQGKQCVHNALRMERATLRTGIATLTMVREAPNAFLEPVQPGNPDDEFAFRELARGGAVLVDNDQEGPGLITVIVAIDGFGDARNHDEAMGLAAYVLRTFELETAAQTSQTPAAVVGQQD